MNTFIIQKCLDELNAKEPNISYIKGILETLIVMSGVSPQTTIIPKPLQTMGATTNVDEEIIPEFLKVGPVKQMTYDR